MIDRRSLLVTFAASTMLGAKPVAAQPDLQEWLPFNRIIELFGSLLQATDILADHINLSRFRSLLRRIDATLLVIAGDKARIRSILTQINCSEPQAVMLDAREAAQRMKQSIERLAEQADILSLAIKPGEARDAAERIADGMRGLQSQKMWLGELVKYCALSSTDKAKFIERIDHSLTLVRASRDALQPLLTKFS